MCFVWISEQTAIISLYSINWLVCITETECVYCAVRTESLNEIEVNIPQLLHTHSDKHVALTIKTNGQSLRTFQKATLFRKSGVLYREVLSFSYPLKQPLPNIYVYDPKVANDMWPTTVLW
jgi:hypothetical protein